MLGGFFYLLAQVSGLLALTAVIGILIGHFVWSRPPAHVDGGGSGDGSPALAHLEQRLVTSESEVANLRAAVASIEDTKEAEMGRLESGAIEALDSLIATHQRRLLILESELQTATSTARDHERELEAERRRSLRLQAALAERDEHLAALAARLADQERRLEERALPAIEP